MFYKVNSKTILEAKKRIFIEKGIPALKANGFSRSPFTTSWYGRNNLGYYTFSLCRLAATNHLEYLIIDIAKGDRFIQVYLNVFLLNPIPKSIDKLKETEGLAFQLSPSNLTRMRLRSDDIQTIPLLNFTEHKIGRYFTKKGFETRIEELGELIENDMSNIDSFVKRWHELHIPIVTDWEGNPIE